jgi:hypothetical protein
MRSLKPILLFVGILQFLLAAVLFPTTLEPQPGVVRISIYS